MSILKKIYKKFPAFTQDILISLYGYKLKKERYGDVYRDYLKTLLTEEHETQLSEVEKQNRLLVRFVEFAKQNSHFYRDLYSNIALESFSGLSDLHQLPVVTKEMLRTNIERVKTIPDSEGITSFTGGTTGKSLEVVFTKDDFQRRMAYLDAFKIKLGIDPDKVKKATFSGRELLSSDYDGRRYWRNNYAYKQRLYSTFHMNEENLRFYVHDLLKYKPQVINGFVSAIHQVARYIIDNEISLTFKPEAIFTTSETLLPYHRKDIELAFSSKVYNQYASAEGAPFVTECKYGNLHYNLDTGVIEQHPNKDSILVTSFTSHGTPLIRYDIGDVIRFKEGTCDCGVLHPLVESIEGRAVDFIEMQDGTKVSLSHLADIIKGMPNSVKQIQFHQHSGNKVELKIVIDEALFTDNHERLLLESSQYRFGENAEVILSKVDSIAKEKSGKYALIKKHI